MMERLALRARCKGGGLKRAAGRPPAYEFSGRTHGSVGFTYDVEYDADAFSAEWKTAYKHPEQMESGMCGGDEAVETCRLTAKKAGKFVVCEVWGCQGKETKREKHIIKVRAADLHCS